jgi:hypothetical protein
MGVLSPKDLDPCTNLKAQTNLLEQLPSHHTFRITKRPTSLLNLTFSVEADSMYLQQLAKEIKYPLLLLDLKSDTLIRPKVELSMI